MDNQQSGSNIVNDIKTRKKYAPGANADIMDIAATMRREADKYGSTTDMLGSYTGTSAIDRDPVQDADDL
jgi:hypothetical protein